LWRDLLSQIQEKG